MVGALALLLIAILLSVSGGNGGAPQATTPPGGGTRTAVPTQPGDTGPTTPAPQPATATVPAEPTDLPTATPLPFTLTPSITPSLTKTPTPEYCRVQVKEGDDLISLMMGCGHRSLYVGTAVLELNDNLPSANLLPAGQELLIPWPSPTPGGEPTETAPPVSGGSGSALAAAAQPTMTPLFGGSSGDADGVTIITLTPVPTETPRADIAEHVVQPGDTLSLILYEYNTTLRVLEALNPQIDFRGCELGKPLGGPGCNPPFIAGNIVRVPVPTPTPTFTPTLDPAISPTPSLTLPAPLPIGPEDGWSFARDEAVTLRWLPVEGMRPNELYAVQVNDLNGGGRAIFTTEKTFLVLPAAEIQPQDGRAHRFSWAVGIVPGPEANGIRLLSDDMIFTWESAP
jgi:LysM repeat protein